MMEQMSFVVIAMVVTASTLVVAAAVDEASSLRNIISNRPYYSDYANLKSFIGVAEMRQYEASIRDEGRSTCEAAELFISGVDDVLDTKNYTSYMLCGYICPNYIEQSEAADSLTHSQKSWVTSLSRRNTVGDENTRIRKNMMELNGDEWSTLTKAMRRIMKDKIGDMTKCDILMQVHQTCAHTAPLFGPWHREFGLRYENALREYDDSITIPFWDITADSFLPYPQDSMTWSEELLGNTDGTTSEGHFRYWPIPSFGCDETVTESDLAKMGIEDGYLFRAVGNHSEHLYDDSDLAYVYTLPNYNAYITDGSCFAILHGNVHQFVGGITSPEDLEEYRKIIPCSFGINPLYDPMFIFYHTFLDYSYAQYRAYGQIEGDVESDWIEEKYTGCPAAYDTALTLKEMKNIDLLSSEYEEIFRYETRRVACRSSSDCGSELMWCSSEYRRCLSKVRKGARCVDLPDEACYDSACSDGGVCQ